ncbi:MAG: carbohydrate ABC transporter permease [Candidatus Sericytochromatia bacterium]
MNDRQDWKWAMLLLLPSLLGVGIFTAIPVLSSFALSFARWNMLSPAKFVGLQNYLALFADPLFWKVMLNTFNYAIVEVLLEVPIALGLAVAMNQPGWLSKMFRTVYFLPVVTSMVAIALVWNWIYDPQYGLLNAALKTIGLQPMEWLFNPKTALPALILLGVWKNVGYSMVIFLAGLQTIPEELYEAASLDGANAWQKFRNITLPQMGPTLFFVSVMATITAFQVFDPIYIMTQGGPENSTSTAVYWLYQNAFEFFNVGRASAIAYMLFFVILTLTMIQWSLRKKWVEQES